MVSTSWLPNFTDIQSVCSGFFFLDYIKMIGWWWKCIHQRMFSNSSCVQLWETWVWMGGHTNRINCSYKKSFEQLNGEENPLNHIFLMLAWVRLFVCCFHMYVRLKVFFNLNWRPFKKTNKQPFWPWYWRGCIWQFLQLLTMWQTCLMHWFDS